MADNELNGTLESLLKLVSIDDANFNPEEFMSNWPDDPATQRAAMAFLTVRNSRELHKLVRGYPRLWVMTSLALGLSVVAIALQAGLDLLPSLVGAIVVGLIGLALRGIG